MIFEIKGKPKGQGRPRVTIIAGKTHIYKDSNSRQYETNIANAYREAGGGLLEGPVRLSVLAYFTVNKSARKDTRNLMLQDKIAPTKKPDLDNILKSIMDGLNGVAYKDDAQVVSVDAQKFYSEEERVIVMITKDGRTLA